MANACVLSHEQIVQRRQGAINDIILAWQPMQGAPSYILQCPCGINCDCNNQSPRITLQACLYVGELDYFEVHHPFVELGFYVSWYCNTCHNEMACGMPT